MNNGRYKNQNVAVLGAGLSGSAAALLLASEGAQVTVLDNAGENNLLKSTLDNLRGHGVRVVCGSGANQNSSAYDWMVLSPGIDPVSPLARNFSSCGIDTISELELGWRSCEMPVIAVTGTNGKTTTTELLAQMLNACGQRTIACGNIGKPLSEVARENQPLDVLTVEVSSFQLEAIRTFRPSISLCSTSLLTTWIVIAPSLNIAPLRCAFSKIRPSRMSRSSTLRKRFRRFDHAELPSALILIAPISGCLTAQSFMKISRCCAWLTRNSAGYITSRT
jgi:Mur ligase MurD-like, N-terminal domain/Mur ligase middle domain/NAD(P)-binding Rossmann-like domain